MTSALSDFTKTFPEELSLKVFSNLDLTTLVNSNFVNKAWHRLTSDDSLWKIIIKNYFDHLSIPEKDRNKAHLSKFIFSEVGILKRLETFIQKVQLNQDAELSCKLPGDSNHFFTANFAYYDKNFGTVLKQEYLFGKKIVQSNNQSVVVQKVEEKSEKSFTLSTYNFRQIISYDTRLNSNFFIQKVENIISNRMRELDNQVEKTDQYCLTAIFFVAAFTFCVMGAISMG